ncbi:MAG: hypothetical protein FWG04_02770 [Desulfovibrionaceae bacterium]|nr:hypothetical protein [Desulfovibrionaceae bacterium]
MSIARQLENSVTKLRVLIQRGNGDLLEAGPAVLDDLDATIEQVRGLENMANINEALLQDFQSKGGVDDTASY